MEIIEKDGLQELPAIVKENPYGKFLITGSGRFLL